MYGNPPSPRVEDGDTARSGDRGAPGRRLRRARRGFGPLAGRRLHRGRPLVGTSVLGAVSVLVVPAAVLPADRRRGAATCVHRAATAVPAGVLVLLHERQ